MTTEEISGSIRRLAQTNNQAQRPSRKLKLSTNLKPEIYKRVERLALFDGRSLSNMVAFCLEKALPWEETLRQEMIESQEAKRGASNVVSFPIPLY